MFRKRGDSVKEQVFFSLFFVLIETSRDKMVPYVAFPVRDMKNGSFIVTLESSMPDITGMPSFKLVFV